MQKQSWKRGACSANTHLPGQTKPVNKLERHQKMSKVLIQICNGTKKSCYLKCNKFASTAEINDQTLAERNL